MNELPQSSRIVLRALIDGGAMTHSEIVKKTRCKPRTVRYALQKLRENHLLIMTMNVRDMRQIIYRNRTDAPAAGKKPVEVTV